MGYRAAARQRWHLGWQPPTPRPWLCQHTPRHSGDWGSCRCRLCFQPGLRNSCISTHAICRGCPLNSGLSSPAAGLALPIGQSRLGDRRVRALPARLAQGSSFRGSATIHPTRGSRDYSVRHGTLPLSGLGHHLVAPPIGIWHFYDGRAGMEPRIGERGPSRRSLGSENHHDSGPRTFEIRMRAGAP
jgi:hypothetical protein